MEEDLRYRQISLYITRLLLYVGVIGLAAWMLKPFTMPMILAAITASIFNQLRPRVPARFRANNTLFAATATLTALLVLVLPLFLLLLLAGLEAVHFVQFVQQMLETNGFSYLSTKLTGVEHQINAQLQAFGASVNFKTIQQDALAQLQNLGTLLYNNALNLLNNTFMIGLNTFYFLFITFFLILDGDKIGELIKKLLPFDRKTSETLVDSVKHVGQTVLVGGLISSLIFGGLMAVAFTLFGFGSPLMWGIMLGILSLIPMGTVIVYIPCVIYLIFAKSLWIALLFLVVVELIEQVLFYVVIRPKFIDSRTRMYPLAIFLAIVSGVTNFGPMGLIYGPIIMAALLALLEHQLSLSRQADNAEAEAAMAAALPERLPEPPAGEAGPVPAPGQG